MVIGTSPQDCSRWFTPSNRPIHFTPTQLLWEVFSHTAVAYNSTTVKYSFIHRTRASKRIQTLVQSSHYCYVTAPSVDTPQDQGHESFIIPQLPQVTGPVSCTLLYLSIYITCCGSKRSSLSVWWHPKSDIVSLMFETWPLSSVKYACIRYMHA